MACSAKHRLTPPFFIPALNRTKVIILNAREWAGCIARTCHHRFARNNNESARNEPPGVSLKGESSLEREGGNDGKRKNKRKK